MTSRPCEFVYNFISYMRNCVMSTETLRARPEWVYILRKGVTGRGLPG
jgi:hypothetical protein